MPNYTYFCGPIEEFEKNYKIDVKHEIAILQKLELIISSHAMERKLETLKKCSHQDLIKKFEKMKSQQKIEERDFPRNESKAKQKTKSAENPEKKKREEVSRIRKTLRNCLIRRFAASPPQQMLRNCVQFGANQTLRNISANTKSDEGAAQRQVLLAHSSLGGTALLQHVMRLCRADQHTGKRGEDDREGGEACGVVRHLVVLSATSSASMCAMLSRMTQPSINNAVWPNQIRSCLLLLLSLPPTLSPPQPQVTSSTDSNGQSMDCNENLMMQLADLSRLVLQSIPPCKPSAAATSSESTCRPLDDCENKLQIFAQQIDNNVEPIDPEEVIKMVAKSLRSSKKIVGGEEGKEELMNIKEEKKQNAYIFQSETKKIEELLKSHAAQLEDIFHNSAAISSLSIPLFRTITRTSSASAKDIQSEPTHKEEDKKFVFAFPPKQTKEERKLKRKEEFHKSEKQKKAKRSRNDQCVVQNSENVAS